LRACAGGGIRPVGVVGGAAFGGGLTAIRGAEAGGDAASFGAQQGFDLCRRRHCRGGCNQAGGHAGRHRAGDPGSGRSYSGGHGGKLCLAAGPEGSMMRALLKHPLTWILVAAAGLRLAGLLWGLPASDGWDDDGFAPRNFLTALALTWKPGSYFTYPPLHAIALAIPALPGILVALLHLPSFHQADVIAEFTRPGIMTYFAVVAR